MTRNFLNTNNMTAFKTLTDEISDQFLACKMCQETYKRPKTLSCLHTFCTSCLEAHLESEEERTNYRFVIYSRSITCPVCKQRTEVPSGGIKNLPDNFLVSNLTEVVNRSKPSSSTPACDICSSYKKRSRDAVSKCLECSKFLCKTCVDLHKKTKVTKGHNVFDVEVEKNVMCKFHDEEPVRFFCQPCETCICVVCTFQEHMGHEVSSFGEGILKYEGNVQSLLKLGESKMSSVQRQLDVMTKCEDTIAQVEERVNKLSTTFLTEIRTQQKQIIDEIRHFYGSEALEILDNKYELEQILTDLKSTCGLAELILENRNVELLLLQKELKDKMKSLINVELPDLPNSMEREIKFVEGSLNLGFLDTGGKASTLDRQVSWENVASNNKGSKDACTMTVKTMKDRGVCTDPIVSRASGDHFDNHSSEGHHTKDNTNQDQTNLQNISPSDEEHEVKFKTILQRRDSLHHVFKDDEKFFNTDDECDRSATLDGEEVSSSTLVEGAETKDDQDQADVTPKATSSVVKDENDIGIHRQRDDNKESIANDTGDDVSDDDDFMDQEEQVNKMENEQAGFKDDTGVEGKDQQEKTYDVDEYIESETIALEESCPAAKFQTCEYRDASTVTEDIEIISKYSELCLETDGGQTLSTFAPTISTDRETMAEFNVQRLSAGNLTRDMYRRESNQENEEPWQIIHDMHQLPVQTAEIGINVPDVLECDSSLEIEFIDVMLRDSGTSTDIIGKSDQQTMTSDEYFPHTNSDDSKKDIRSASREENTLIKSSSLELFTQTISDTLAITADAKKGLLELADGFYDIKDVAEFTLLETENSTTPDGTILFSKTIHLSDQGTEMEAEVKVQTVDASCGIEVPMRDEATEVKAEMVESSTSPDVVDFSDLCTQTTVAVSETETMTEQVELRDSAMLTEAPAMRDSICGPDYQCFSTVGTETFAPELVDQCVGDVVESRDAGCGDSIATVQNVGASAIPEMIDSSCSPEVICYSDTCLQTDGWDFKDAYVDTDSINVRDIFTEMPELHLMDVFTNTQPSDSADASTATDIAQFADQGSVTDSVRTNLVGTLTDILRMCDATVETMPLETSEVASEISPENSTKETMTPVFETKEVATNARFRRKRPATTHSGTSTDSVDSTDCATETFTETNSIGLSISPETTDDSTETPQPCLVDTGVGATPDTKDTGTHAPTLNTCDSSTDPIKPQQASVGINTYIVSIAPRMRDASTTTARTMEEISQELETVVLRGAVRGDTVEQQPKEPTEPEVDSDLLGQKISELFSLSKLQSLTEKLAQDRRRMEEQRSRKHVLPTARMLEKRLSIDESQPIVIKRRLSTQKSIDIPNDNEKDKTEFKLPAKTTNVEPKLETEPGRTTKVEPKLVEKDFSRKKRPNIATLMNLPKVSEAESRSAVSLIDFTPSESSLDVSPGVSPCMTPSGDNLSSFSDAVEPVREKKRKHKKEKKKSKDIKEKERIEEEHRQKSSSLKFGCKLDAGAMASATTPDEDNPKKEKKSIFSLGKFSKSLPTLARLDGKLDRFFRRPKSRDNTPSTSVANTPQTSRSGSPERRPPQRKVRAPKVASLVEQIIIEKARSSTSSGDSGPSPKDDGPKAFIIKESNV